MREYVWMADRLRRLAGRGVRLMPEPVQARVGLLLALVRREGSPFVSKYAVGLTGVEIGAAAHNRFWLDAVNVDVSGAYKWGQRKVVGHAAKIDVFAPGDDLPFDDDSHDFVFSSHAIEHFYDPIGTLEEWRRVARMFVILVVPHRDRTFDAGRSLTPVSELERRRTAERPTGATEDRHWTVWTRESFLAMCDHFNFEVVDSIDPDDKVGNGFAVVIDATG